MNAIICGFHAPPYRKLIYNVLTSLKLKKCHLFYNESGIRDIPDGTEAIQYEILKIRYKLEYPLEFHNIKPLDRKILEDMYPCEVICLKMMDRLIRFPDYKDSYHARKNIYLKHLAYWNHIIDEDGIDFVLFHSVPHVIYNYIIYNLCKLKKIKTIVLTQALNDNVLIFDGFSEYNLSLKKKYTQLLKEFESSELTDILLAPRVQDLYDFQVNNAESPVPFYMKKVLKKKSIFNGIKWVLNHIRPKYYFKIIKIYFQQKKMDKFYKKLTVKPDLNEKFIYYPLHFQPELSTIPLAGPYVEQQLTIKLLSYLIPDNFKIYVKEHPAQRTWSRDFEFYKEIYQLPNVRLIEKKYNTFSLLDNCIAIATSTGSAAWEGLFRGKPSILFGTIFFQYANGIFSVKTLEECANALDQIIINGVKPSLKETKLYLKALELCSFPGHINYSYGLISKIPENLNINNLVTLILKKINDSTKKITNVQKI